MAMTSFRKIILALCCLWAAYGALAQTSVKRPDTYNYQLGIEAYNDGRFRDSFDYFEKELAQNPKDGYAMLCFGRHTFTMRTRCMVRHLPIQRNR